MYFWKLISRYFRKKKRISYKIVGDKSLVKIGRNTVIDPDVILDVSEGGSICIGDNCIIYKGVIISTYGGAIQIGDYCSFNPYCVLYGHGGLKIGSFVRVATHSIFIPANHIYSNRDIPIMSQGLSVVGIEIEDDVWIGAAVKILDGIKVGRGTVIAAGSVLTKSVDSYSIYAGVPAKKIKNR